MLQFGFIHSAEIDGVSNIVRVPAESFELVYLQKKWNLL